MNTEQNLTNCLKEVQDLLSRAVAGLDIESNEYLVEQALAIINSCLTPENPQKLKNGWVKMPFGKHKGTPVNEVIEEDPQYFNWFVYKSGIVPRGLLREAINEYIRIHGGKEFGDDDIPAGHDVGDFSLFDAMDGCLPNQ